MQPNYPIGALSGVEFVGEEIDNVKGRPLFLYTGGLCEAENRQQERFGNEHLLDVLRNTRFGSARQMVETVAARVKVHRDGAYPNDDVTIMCLRIRE
jgi:sigma-B regulation protein RsbU (phosphoserine phosphatase)